MNNKMNSMDEFKKLQSKITELEKEKSESVNTKKELKAANMQLEASEQQLKALNEQLKLREKELIEKEKAANEAREFAENILDTVHEPLVVLNQDLYVVSANRFFYATFEVTPEETIGNFLTELGNNQWENSELITLLNDILPEKSIVDDYEIEHDFEHIGKRIMLLNARELVQKEGKRRMILLSIKDITGQREYERTLKLLNKELEAKTNELQQILYITTHDLRSPLVNIQGFNKELENSLKELSTLLNNKSVPDSLKENYKLILDEDIPEAIHFITSSTNKMDALLTGLLSLSRLGRQKMTIQNLNMNQIISDVLDNFKYEISNKKIKVEVANLPDCAGDEHQINQVFSNLIGNAIKFLDNNRVGKIRIFGEQHNEFIKYTIDDNGIGIHNDYQNKVFELFYKLNPKTSGTGLGMNIVKQIVEKHGGWLELESEVDIGTKIYIYLPEK